MMINYYICLKPEHSVFFYSAFYLSATFHIPNFTTSWQLV